MNSLPTCLIIDPDRLAAEALTASLQQYQRARVVGTAASVPGAVDFLGAKALPVDLLFIRITSWNDYLKVAPLCPRTPATVIFLSRQLEKCAHHLPGEVDFHLKPPYLRRQLSFTTAFRNYFGYTPRWVRMGMKK